MQREAQDYVKKCNQCQKFAPNIHQPGGVLNPPTSPWPFAQWGLDIVGPFPKVAGNKRYLLVDTDYFTKWVEVEPPVKHQGHRCQKIFLEEYRYMVWDSSRSHIR